jgi:hypothetical protein
VIKTLTLKFGGSDGGTPLSFEPGVVTVFVGPNNSGKSLALRELWQHMHHLPPPPSKILGSVSFRALSQSDAQSEMARLKQQPRPNELLEEGNIIIASGFRRKQVNENGLRSALTNPAENTGFFINSYLQHQALNLDGTSRLTLANDADSRNLTLPPGNPLDVLLRDNKRRSDLRKIVLEAFDRHLALDTTEPAKIKLKFGDRAPTEDEERSYKDFHSKTEPLQQFSDGVRRL